MREREAFPVGKQRKKTVERTTRDATNFRATGEIEILDFEHYTWVDSPLLEDGSGRKDKNSFAHSFQGVMPEGVSNIKNYIEAVLEKRKGKAVGVEFGGIGSRLFRGFTQNFFARSIAVSLLDHRGWEFQLAELAERDRKINHEVLEGNIFDPKTYESLSQKLGNEKVDFIIERMGQGMEFVPAEPYTVSKTLKIWYDLLNEGGVMFVQTPVVFNNLLETWVNKIRNEFKETIEIQYMRGYEDNGAFCSSFRLRKLPGAPSEMPLLDVKTVAKTPKAKPY